MPQALRGYGREERDSTLRIDLQHLVVSIVDDIKISLPSNAIPFGQLKRSLFANDETLPSFAIFAIELPRQFATKTSPVSLLIAIPTGPLRPLVANGCA